MSDSTPIKVELQRMAIPNEQVDITIRILKKDPRYVAHDTTDNRDGTTLIEVLLKTGE